MSERKCETLSLTPRQQDALAFFARYPASSLHDLAAALHISLPVARRHLLRLRLKGMIAPAFSTPTADTQGFVLTPTGLIALRNYSGSIDQAQEK